MGLLDLLFVCNCIQIALAALINELELDTNSYLQLIKQIDLFNVNKHYQLLTKRNGDDSWSEQSHTNTIAAFYNPRRNALIFPAGLLQEPFFDSERPRYVNYGTLGSLIGHEIIHGFDNQGKHYDEDGGFENWWTSRTESDYAKAIQCITELEQYEKLPDIGLNVNHLNRIDEVIADIGGSKLAYLAYQKWVEHYNTPEPLLPGLNYTQNQLFWISAASIWCSKFQSEDEIICPGLVRVHKTMNHLEEFSKDFDCYAGSYMNPLQKRCAIW